MALFKASWSFDIQVYDLSISVTEMLSSFPQQPLVGTRTKKSVGSNGTGTYWFAFIKLPAE